MENKYRGAKPDKKRAGKPMMPGVVSIDSTTIPLSSKRLNESLSPTRKDNHLRQSFTTRKKVSGVKTDLTRITNAYRGPKK